MALSSGEHQHVEGALTHLAGAIKGRALYPAGHPAVLAPVSKAHQLLQGVLKVHDPLVLALVDDTLVVEDRPYYDAPAPVADIAARLAAREIGGLVVRRGVTLNELLALLELLMQEPAALAAAGGAQQALTARQVEHLEVKRTVEDDLDRRAQEAYAEALGIVANLFHEVRLGRIPKAAEAKRVVAHLGDLILRDRDVLLGLTMLKNYDDYTYNHSVNVCILSLALGERLRFDRDQLTQVGIAGLLHDIGKTSLCLQLIRKPGKLSQEEFDEIKKHPTAGAKILKRMAGIHPEAVLAVLQHHLRFNRSGYPRLPDHVRVTPLSYVVAIADTYDALTTIRSYQPSHQPRDALEIMAELAGTDLEPRYFKTFTEMLGIYPVGTLVRLDTNEIALVVRANPRQPTAPRVKILFDAGGARLDAPVEADLTELDPKSGRPRRQIVATVDPALKGIDVGALLGPLVTPPGPPGSSGVAPRLAAPGS
ncbi:MAG TPA: HD-GYP domain-containing protein [Thermodesulfobacteriota bacterium]|nr:HD-GYP domain-containing protein [Thermodesulfobacteriota bacterium]